MPTDLFRTFRDLVEDVFWGNLTRKGYAKLLVLLAGWILTVDQRHAVTAALVAAGAAGVVHHEGFHRFFSRGSWDPDALGLAVARRVVQWQGPSCLRFVVDDTLSEHKGPRIFGLGCHLNAVRSTRVHKVLSFGHCWVVLSIVVQVPFSRRWWALPVLFRLYRQQRDCEKAGHVFRKKTELARELIELFCKEFGDRRIEGTGDQAYSNSTVLKHRPTNLTWYGAMRPDAAISAPAEPRKKGQRGPPRKKGERLPSPAQIVDDPTYPWQPVQVTLYGKQQWVWSKTYEGQWYAVCADLLLRIVIVETTQGDDPYRVYFCTDHTTKSDATLETYGSRWSAEVFHFEGKQFLGLAESGARLQNAVLRVFPFVGWIYTLLVVWFAEGAWLSPFATPPVRTWYPHKDGASFADILRTARRVLARVDILAEACVPCDLHQSPTPRPRPVQLMLPLAA